jgi:pimeloyl-ACP methyl ester carboxylesterase
MTDTLLLLPGFDGTGILFADFQKAIEPQYRIIVASYQDEVTFEEYVEKVTASLPTDACVLIAESFSGPIAMALMQKHPGRIKSVVLCATFLVSPFRLLTRFAHLLPARALHARTLTRRLLQLMCLNGEPQQRIEQVCETVVRLSARTLKQRLDVLSHVDMRSSAREIETPALILQPMRDRLISEARYRELAKVFALGTLQKIDGPHLLLQSRPQECWRAIREFLEHSQQSFAEPQHT